MAKGSEEVENRPADQVEDDDEPDEWDKRINKTGCAGASTGITVLNKNDTLYDRGKEENTKMTDCYWEKKDWRACVAEMEAFKKCWKTNENDKRTDSKDV